MPSEAYSSVQSRDRTKAYRIVGFLMVVALAIVVLLAFAGARGPGLFTDTAAFFGLGFGLLILAIVLTFVLFTMRALVVQVRREHAEVQVALREIRQTPPPVAVARPVLAPEPASVDERTETREEPPFKTEPPRTESVLTPETKDQVRDGPTARATLAPPRTEHARQVRAEPAIEIEGIGTRFAERLKEISIETIGDLRAADPADVAKRLKTHPTVVRQWQAMGDLMEVRGVGKQFSELLVRSGIRSSHELAAANPEVLFQKIEDTNAGRDVRIQGAPVGPDTCRAWVANAHEVVGTAPSVR